MRTWGMMLGGLLIWAFHFLGVYVIASLADVVATADDFTWRMVGLAFSALCLIAVIAAGVWAYRAMRGEPRSDMRSFGAQVGVLGAAIAGLGVIFQSLPNVVGY